MSFREFSIDPRCLKILDKQKITDPMPVQEKAIPVAIEGHDLIAIAQTGTGKTLAFSLPALTDLAKYKPERNSMLVITPTRELAIQVNEVIEQYAKALKLRSICLYGGVGIEPQARALRQGREIIVATPGRLLDHVSRKNIDFSELAILVLDEADRMLDMGFLPDIRKIIKLLPTDRQTMMFSATFPPNIRKLAEDMLHEPEYVEIVSTAKPVETVRQVVYTVVQTGKQELLARILREEEAGPTLVFVRTKRRADRVSKMIRGKGFKAQAIHGDRTQRQRQQALDGFKQGRYKVLVATDVAARGIDVQGITHVINYDIPGASDDYIHRIGRTARANAEGDAITFVCPEDHLALNAIERTLGKNIPREEWEGSVAVLSLFRESAGKGARGNRKYRGTRRASAMRARRQAGNA